MVRGSSWLTGPLREALPSLGPAHQRKIPAGLIDTPHGAASSLYQVKAASTTAFLVGTGTGRAWVGWWGKGSHSGLSSHRARRKRTLEYDDGRPSHADLLGGNSKMVSNVVGLACREPRAETTPCGEEEHLRSRTLEEAKPFAATWGRAVEGVKAEKQRTGPLCSQQSQPPRTGLKSY